MKNIFFNPKKAEKERVEKARLEEEGREEREYLEILKADERFKKYVLEKRLNSVIARLSDSMSTPDGVMTPEQLEREIAARKSTVRALKDIFNSIMN